jgi:hypothetical protein
MPELSLRHVEEISRYIGRQEITFSHLADDLTDHICCDIEDEMKEGLEFNDAFKKVILKIGSRRLKELQEETLFAIDTKYRNMKKTMKISGVTGTMMLGFASMFKIEHFPGAGILMTLGAIILAFLFLPSALSVLWKETHRGKRLFLFIAAFFAGLFFIMGILLKIQHWPGAGLVLILAGLSGILLFIPALLKDKLSDPEKKAKRPVYVFGAAGIIFYSAGILFKIQHWPGAGTLMISGVAILGVIAFPWYTWLTWKDDWLVSARYIFMVIGSVAIIVPGALINLNLQNSYDYGFFVNQEHQQAIYNYKSAGNLSLMDKYKDSNSYPLIKQIHSKTAGVVDLITNIQTKMVLESEGKPDIPAMNTVQITPSEFGPEIQYKRLSKPFHTGPVKDFLLPGCNPRQELSLSLSDYKKFLSDLNSGEDFKIYESLLDPALFLPEEKFKGAEISLMSGLHSLELLKNSILTVESHMIISVANK